MADGTIGTPGIDIDGVIGDNITSFTNGVVTSVKESPTGYGKNVIVTDENGNQHYYNHLDSFNVQQGQQIVRGDNIGTMGNTGSVVPGPQGDGSHLDYRVKDVNGQWINPIS